MASVSVSVCVIFSLIATPTLIFGDSCSNCQNEVKIPIEMALRLNTITDERQLMREFMKGDVEPVILSAHVFPVKFAPDSVSDATQNDEPVERKAVKKPKPAECIPELKAVSLRKSEDPWIQYWPSCTRIEQCGGCCSHHLLSCQPVEVEIINYSVNKMEYTGDKMIYKGKEIIPIEKHIKCKCDCIVKEEHCNPLQEYRKGECRCVCSNKDAEAKCNYAEGKHWNSTNCTCECLNVEECSTGTFFNHSTCSCETVPGYEDSKTNRRRWPVNYSFNQK